MGELTATVRQLFDRKAGPWARSYGAGGALEHRCKVFSDTVTAHCPPGRLLDFGCGTGHIGGRLAEQGYVVHGCDMSAAMLEEGRRAFANRVDLRLLDGASSLPYPDQHFDAAIASSVLEYVEDPKAVLADLGRVVRPGGFLFVSVPNMRHPRRWVEAGLERLLRVRPICRLAELQHRTALHARYLLTSRNRFSRLEWRRRLEEAGFSLRDRRFVSPLLDLFVLHRDP